MEIKFYITIEIPDDDAIYEMIMEEPENIISDEFSKYKILDLEVK